jgi:hypothetical protein
MAEPFKSTPASRVFGMGLPRRSNLPPATFFGTPIAEERRFLNPKLRQNALAEQELEAKENALAAEQAKRNMELKGQEAMGRAFEELSQGEDIENIFRKNPAIVFSPQFDQLSRATEFVQPSKAVKALVPNLAKSLPPEFRSEFIAKASNLTNTDEVLGAYTDTELKKSMAEQRGRLGELGVDISQLKPDYLYTPAEEAAFKTKAAIAREMAKLDLERKKTSEGALEQARQWALKRGAQANLVNMLDNPSAIYQLGASIGGSRNEAASRQIIDRKSRLFSIAKDELEGAKRDLQNSEFDDPDVIDAKQKILDAAQERYNQARSDFENVLIEPPVEEEGLPGMQLPYDLYSVGGIPSATKGPAISPAAQRGAATAEDITSPAATGGAPKSFKETMKEKAASASQLPTIPKVDDKEILADLNNPEADENTFEAAINDPNTSMEVKKAALEKLKKFAESPKFPFGTTTREANSRIFNLKEQIKAAEKNIRMVPEMENYRKTWTQEKKDMESYVKDFAKSLGLDFDLVIADIAKAEPATDDPENPFTVRDQFEMFLAKKMGIKPSPPSKGALSRQSDRLLKFTGGEFAQEFGLKGPIPGFRSFGKGKTYGDVLDAYLGEKFPEQTSQPSVAAPQEMIVDVTTREEVEALPKGTKFKWSNGKVYIK